MSFSLDAYMRDNKKREQDGHLPVQAPASFGTPRTGGSPSGGFSLDDYIIGRGIRNGQLQQQDNDFNAWLGNVESFSSRMASEQSKRMDVYQAPDAFGAYQNKANSEINDLLKQAYTSKNYYTQYGGLYDEARGDGTSRGLLDGIEQNIKYLEGVRSGLRGEADYWGQFADETAYNDYKRISGYAELPKSADFAEKSVYDAAGNASEKKMNILATLLTGEGGGIVYDDPGYKDLLYAYINGDEEAGAILRQQDADMYGAGSGAIGRAFAHATEGKQESQHMTDDEIKLFNYLYATEGKEAAYEYYDFLKSDLYRRNREADEAYWAGEAEKNPFGSSVFSVAMSPARGISYLMQAADYIGGGSIDQNAPYNKFSYIPSSIRTKVSDTIENSGKWGGVGSFGYNTAMSMADFLFNTAISGGNQALTLAIMGTGAAADTTIAAKDRGLSDGQAFALGTIAGAAEVITEKISLDALLNANWEEGAVKYILKNTLAEGSEEVGSDVINLVGDILIAKDKSEWQLSVDAYKAQGMSESEAVGRAVADQAATMGLDFLGGALSGGIMSGTSAGFNAAGTYMTGREFNNMDLSAEDIQAFIDEGLSSDPSTQSYKLADAAQKKIASGGTLTNYELGNLYQANARAIGAEDDGAAMLEQAARDIAEGKRVSNSAASAILGNVNAMNTLKTEAGLNISDDMSKSKRRDAVREAVKSLARPNAEISRDAGVISPSATETAQEQITAPVRNNVAAQAWNSKRLDDALSTLGRVGMAQGKVLYDGESQNAYEYFAGFSAYYEAGVTGMDMGKVQSQYANSINQAQKQAAYLAGQTDAAASLASEQGNVQYATVYGNEAGFIPNEHSAKLPKQTTVYLNSIARATGIKIQMEAATGAGGANGWYANGVLHIAADAENPGVVVAAHEITHRMQEMAPDEYRRYRDLAVQIAGAKGGTQALVEAYKARYAEAGQNLTTEQAMDEIAADFTKDLLREVDGFRELAVKDRSVAQKLLASVRDFIRKVKSLFRGNTAKQNSAAQDYYGVDIATLEEAARLWGEALEATKAQARNAENVEVSTGEDGTFMDDHVRNSLKVTDRETLDFLESQDTITTYKTMQLVDGKLYPPMAARTNGKYEDYSELGKWEQATEHPELAKDGKFKLDKGKGQGSIVAAYNPYMHSSNLVLNDQFSGAYTRNNLVTVECEVPVSEKTSGYHADGAKDSVGWHAWHTGTVAGQLRKQTGTERQVFLSRWIKPVRILPDAEVAGMYKDLLGGTNIAVPDNVVTPGLLNELKKAGVRIKESGRVKNAAQMDGEARLSIKRTKGMTLSEQLKAFYDGKMASSDALYFGETPGNLDAAELEALPLAFTQADFKKSTKGKHNVPRRVLKNLNNDLETALFAFRDGDRVGVVTGDIDGDGKPLLVGIQADVQMDADKVNAIRSAYGLDNPGSWLKNQIEEGKTFFLLDEKRANTFLYPYGYLASRKEGIRSTGESIPQDAEEVKDKFSLKSPVEETKDLLALHNLTEKNLLDADELGGLPMPSIAVVKADAGHSQYGPISLVFGKDSIDPQTDSRNKVYGSDAWTPVASNAQVEYEVRYDDMIALERRLAELSRKAAGGVFSRGSPLRSLGVEDSTDKSADEITETLARKDEVKAAYLADIGEDIEVSHKEKQYNRYWENDVLRQFIDTVGEQRLATAVANLELGGSIADAVADVRKDVVDATIAAYEEKHRSYLDKREAKIPGSKQRSIDKYVQEKVTPFYMEDFVRNAWELYEDGGQRSDEIDILATGEALRERASEADVKAWLLPQVERIISGKGIYNGKEVYTARGNRRSFKDLHWDYTLDNIVRAMNQSSARGANMWGITGSSLVATATPSYGSIDEIRADKGRLKTLPKEEYDAVVNKVGDQLGDVISNIMASTKHHSDNSFEEIDIIGSIIIEAAQKKNRTADSVQKAFQKEGYSITKQQAARIILCCNEAAQVPTGYFEAKPQRGIGFEEALAAVIPDDASEKVRKALSGKGVNVLTYKAGDEADRLAKVNSVEGARFSLKTDSTGKQLSDGQAEYFKDSKVLDARGNLMVMYHGTPYGGYTVFRDGSYFTDNPEYAETYHSPSASSIRGRYDDATNPMTYAVYLNMKKPFDTRKADARKIFYDEYYRQYGMGTDLMESGLPDWMDAEDLREFLEENGYDYDGLIVDEGGTGGYGEEVKRRGFAYITFSSNQVKSVGNTAPTDDPDIRYSLKSTGDLQRDMRMLEEENELLRERVDYWKGQTRRTKRVTTDKKAVTAAARSLIESMGAELDVSDIAHELQSLYDYIASGYDESGELTGEEAYRRAAAIAETLVENAVAVDDEMYQTYADLRNYARTTRFVFGKDRHGDIPDFGDFRKRYFGKLNLQTGGETNIDQLYQEMSAMWPEFFNEEAQTHPTDQLLHITEVLDQLYDVSEFNPFDRYQREAAISTANEIMELFFDLPQTKKTFADRAALRLQEERAKGKKRLDDLREQKNARIAELRAQNRERLQQTIQKERERSADKIETLKDRYKAKDKAGREKQSARALRAKIVRHVSALSKKLLRPNDKQHIPEALRGSVAAMLEAINQESQYTIDPDTGKRTKSGAGNPTKRTEAFLALKKQYAKIVSEGGDIVIDPNLLGSDAEGIEGLFDEVIAMKDIKLADMSVSQLQTVWQVIRAVEHSVNTAGKMLSKAKFARTQEWALALTLDTGSRKAKKSLTKSHAMLDMETPYTFFSHFGPSGMAIYRMLRDAQDQQQIMVEQVTDAVRKIVDPKTVKTLEETTHEFTTERGEDFTLSTAQIMELYELMKREQARDHILKGGVVQPEIKSAKIRRGTDSIRLSDVDLANIIKALTDEQIKIADGLQGLTTTLLSDFGNKASMAAYGYKKFTEKDYWPIKSAKEGIHSNIEKGGNNTRSIKNIGLAKTTMPHASNPIDLSGIFSTFASHAGDMTDYAAWLCAMEDANRLFNYEYRDGEGNRTGKTVKGLLDRVGGTGSQKYWHNLMEDIQNGINAPGDSPMWEFVGKGIGSFKSAAVGGNLRVVIQQPTAFFRANAVLSPADLARGVIGGATKGNGWKKALQYSPIAMRKNAGGFDISNPLQMGETLFDSKTKVRKLNEKLSWAAGAADAFTWGKIWNACELATAREHKSLKPGTSAFYEQTAKLFAEVIDQTQVVDGVLQRSNIMRSSNAVVKQATSFMGEPIMSLNLMMRAYDQVRYEQDPARRGKAIKAMGRAATALVVTSVVNSLAQSIIDAMRSDDEDKKYWERFMEAFTGVTGDEESAWDKAVAILFNGNIGDNLNVLGQIPFVKDVLSLIQGYDVSRTEMEIVSDVISAGKTVAQSAGGDGKKTRVYAVKSLLGASAKLFGIPVNNLTRDLWGLARTLTVETDNIPLQYEMEKAIYNLSNEGNKGRYYDILYRALEQGDMVSYEHIRKDLMDTMGLDGVSIDTAMRSRYNKAVEKDPDYKLSQSARDLIASRDKFDTSESEDNFGADDLGYAAFRNYSAQRAETYRTLENDLTQNAMFRNADDETRDKLLSAAYNLADKTALADNSGGQYEITTAWMKWAVGGADYGVDETEAILFKALYDTTQGDTDGDGKTISGSKKENVLEAAAAAMPWLTEAELAYLKSNYWKE